MLHYIAFSDNVETFKLIAQEFSLDPMARNSSNETPLHVASRGGHVELMEYIYSVCKTRSDFDIEMQDSADGSTFLHNAILSSNVEAVNILVKLGASPTKLTRYGTSCLMLAASQKNQEVFDTVLPLDPDVNRLENESGASIHFAAFYGKPDSDVLQVLIIFGRRKRDLIGWTPIAYAIEGFHKDAFDTLIQVDSNLFYRDYTGVGILDRVFPTSPIWEKVEKIRPFQRLLPPLEPEVKRQLVLHTMQNLICYRKRTRALYQESELQRSRFVAIFDFAMLLLNLDIDETQRKQN
jgi:ankyrin repeat protein